MAVAVSIALLVAAGSGMAALWAATYAKNSSSYTAKLPSTLLGVEVAVAGGDIEIVGGGVEDVIVSRTQWSAYGHEPQERRMIVDGVLRIESSCPGLVIGSCAADYRLEVPENVPVTIAADRGDVRVTSYRGSAQLSTRDGSISVDAFCGFVLHATARGGDIDIGAACSPERLELRTDTGDVSVAIPSGTYSIEADSNGGTVEVAGLTRADNAPFRIQALSSSGDVTVEAGS